jgi:hypothetical protein
MNYCSIEDAWGNDFNNNVNFSYNNTSNIIDTKQLKNGMIENGMIENEMIENEMIENEIIEKKKNGKKIKKNVLKGGNINSLISTQEIYIILGLILLFIIDTFSRLGKKIY